MRVQKINNEYLVILHLENDEELARHKIPYGKGKLLKNNGHTREKSKKIPSLITEIAFRFPDPLAADSFLQSIRIKKPRYIRDQLQIIQLAIQGKSKEVIAKALDFCVKNKLHSASDFKDAVAHYHKEQPEKASIPKNQRLLLYLPIALRSLRSSLRSEILRNIPRSLRRIDMHMHYERRIKRGLYRRERQRDAEHY